MRQRIARKPLQCPIQYLVTAGSLGVCRVGFVAAALAAFGFLAGFVDLVQHGFGVGLGLIVDEAAGEFAVRAQLAALEQFPDFVGVFGLQQFGRVTAAV